MKGRVIWADHFTVYLVQEKCHVVNQSRKVIGLICLRQKSNFRVIRLFITMGYLFVFLSNMDMFKSLATALALSLFSLFHFGQLIIVLSSPTLLQCYKRCLFGITKKKFKREHLKSNNTANLQVHQVREGHYSRGYMGETVPL